MATQLSSIPDSPGSQVETAAPRVTLRNYFAHSFDSAIAAARTCYSPRLVNPEEVTEKQRVMIGSGTFFGGHHTVYQHAHFEFGLENVSRQFVWSFLHAHPFYNSEQQSQRYVRLDRAQAYVPPADTPNFGPAERAIYEKAIARGLGPLPRTHHAARAQRARDSRRTSGTSARCRTPSAYRKSSGNRRSGPSKWRGTCCRWRRSPRWCTRFPASSCTACGGCRRPAIRRPKSRQIIGEMVARVREADPQFIDRFDNEPMEELPEWQQPAA